MTEIFSASCEEKVKILSARLDKAERKIKVLNCEVKDIRNQLGMLLNKGNIRLFSTSTRDEFQIDAKPSIIKKPKFEFTMENGNVVIFTDGACENNGRIGAKAGIGIWFGLNHPLNVSEPVKGRPTNNTAEIQACTRALKIAHEQGLNRVTIKTDSQFVISSITQWIKRWKVNNWKTASGDSVKNKEDFILLDEAIKNLEHVQWVKVSGHRGILGNEEADRLAVQGAHLYGR